MNEPAISIRGLGKKYRLGMKQKPGQNFREALIDLVSSPVRRFRGLAEHGGEDDTFWALQDISFDVQPGDVVGVIGRNGAGKSTLLKILSRITEPTVGEAVIRGRLSSLLEVGTGFHKELTGRENIFLNGAILGMRRTEIARKFDEIVAFAEVEKFLDTPVKRYSSGMYVRLAFAVAAHLEPEILVVDEVLAVGDASFQKKCLGKMGEVARGGRTVVFVSHNMAAVQNLCTRGVVLRQGEMAFLGNCRDAVQYYVESNQDNGDGSGGDRDLSVRENKYSPGRLIVRRIRLLDQRDNLCTSVPMGEPVKIVIDVDGLSQIPGGQIGVIIKSTTEQWLCNFNTGMAPPKALTRCDRERVVLTVDKTPFVPGAYYIDVSVAQKGAKRLDYVDRAAVIEVLGSDIYGSGYSVTNRDGVIYLDGKWQIQANEGASPSLPGSRG